MGIKIKDHSAIRRQGSHESDQYKTAQHGNEAGLAPKKDGDKNTKGNKGMDGGSGQAEGDESPDTQQQGKDRQDASPHVKRQLFMKESNGQHNQIRENVECHHLLPANQPGPAQGSQKHKET